MTTSTSNRPERDLEQRSRRHRPAGAIAVILVVALAAPIVLPAPATAARAPDTRRRIALFAHDWKGDASGRTLLAWRRAARRHTVMVGSPGRSYGEMVRKLHGWNPRLKVLVYDLGPYTVAGTELYQRLLARHPRYFARGRSGQLLTVQAVSGSPAFPRNTLMDPGVRGWRRVIARRVKATINRYGYDGVYLDSTGVGVLSGTTTGVPINRRTGQPYTERGWLRAEAKMVNRIRRAIGNKFIFATGLVNGYLYRQSTHILARARLDGMMTDSWMRLSSSSVSNYPSPELFRLNLRMVKDLQARGKHFFGWTKVWTQASDAQRHAWDRFALASYLLVKARKALYSFSPSFTADRTLIFDRMQLARLGRALGPYTVSNGVYRRRFEHGSVRVDPAAHTAQINVTS